MHKPSHPVRTPAASASAAFLPFLAAALLGMGISFGAAVDATTLKNKVLFGYQGWFDCPMAGSGNWVHWSRGVPADGSLTVDLYPDLHDFKTTDLCAAGSLQI